MGKIIYDTNVWYDIAKGGAPVFPNTGFPVHVTFCNIDEVAISANLVKDFDLLRQAIIAMMKNPESAIIENPAHYMIKLEDKNFSQPSFKDRYNDILSDTEAIANGQLTQDFFQDQEIIDVIQKRKDELTSISEMLMISLEGIRTIDREVLKTKQATKQKFWKADYSYLAKEIAKDLIKSTSQTGYQISDAFNWGQVELFISVFEQYIKDYIISNRKMQSNDWYDLWNLVYVQPGDKYYTYEKHWLMLINRAKMDHYLKDASPHQAS